MWYNNNRKGMLMIKNNKKLGFTLAELMVCLAIISVIATLLMPAINKLRPNKNKVMFKKAYYLTERIVSELVNDEESYPFVEDKVGFDNTSEVEFNDIAYSGNSKFCKLFALKLNTLSEDANCTGGASWENPSFTTTDGVKWILPVTDFADPDEYYSILVDVNGDNEPNCQDSEDDLSACPEPDQFAFKLRPDGKMRVDGLKAIEYVGSTNMIENSK